MKYYLNLLMLCFLFSCPESTNKEEELTIEKANEIIAKYNLKEGTFDLKNQGLKDNAKGASITPTAIEFEALVKDLAEYQNSKEGRAASKMSEFATKKKSMTEKEIDDFYLSFDKEFDMNTYELFRKNKNKKEDASIIVICDAEDYAKSREKNKTISDSLLAEN